MSATSSIDEQIDDHMLWAGHVIKTGAKVEAFIRDVVIPYEKDPRKDAHGPSDELVRELRGLAREAGVLTPHILPGGDRLPRAWGKAGLGAVGAGGAASPCCSSRRR